MSSDKNPIISIRLTNLSISSSRKTGLLTLTSLNPWIIRPGMEPMYVRRCPRMSDWSHIPPRAILQKNKVHISITYLWCVCWNLASNTFLFNEYSLHTKSLQEWIQINLMWYITSFSSAGSTWIINGSCKLCQTKKVPLCKIKTISKDLKYIDLAPIPLTVFRSNSKFD